MTVKLIVTHPGSAHKDDFLACSLLAHLHGVPIQRRDPTQEDLSDATICVVDVGGSHDASMNNFDHHQFPKDGPPLCALSLVLQSLELYEDALAFCSWLRPAEWLDTLGPNEAAKKMGIPREAMNELNSPVDISLLRRFAGQTELTAESPIYQIMCMVGEDIVQYLRSLRTRLNYLAEHCELWEIDSDGDPINAVFLARDEAIADDPSFGIYQYVADHEQRDKIVALVYPDRRGEGYGLTRYEDSQRMNFSQVEDCNDVRFAHKRGFVAKTVATDATRLRELLAMAVASK